MQIALILLAVLIGVFMVLATVEEIAKYKRRSGYFLWLMCENCKGLDERWVPIYIRPYQAKVICRRCGETMSAPN